MFKVLIPSWICPVVHPSCVDNWLIAFPLPWIADINSSRVESLFRMFNPSPPPLPRFPKNPPLLFPPHPIKINSNKMAKKSLPNPSRPLPSRLPSMAKILGSIPLLLFINAGKMAVRSARPPVEGSPNMKIFSLPIKMSFFWLNEYFISIKLREGRSGFNYFA